MKKESRVCTWHILIAFLVGVAITYLTKSADCSTGGDCSFANGDLAHFLFPKILWAEKVILGVISN
jgi:hypothetical protein